MSNSVPELKTKKFEAYDCPNSGGTESRLPRRRHIRNTENMIFNFLFSTRKLALGDSKKNVA